jgi:hypothetical protein
VALRWLGAAIATITVVLVLAALRDAALNAWLLAWVGYPIVGALIIWRQPANRIGWWMLSVGACFVAGGLYYHLAHTHTPSAPALVVVLGQPVQALGWLSLAALAALFPSGRAATRSQRVLLRLIGVVAVLASIAMLIDVRAAQDGRHNPLGVPALSAFSAFVVDRGFDLVPLLMLASLASLAMRWRRSVGIERLQFRWLAWALGVCVIGVAVAQPSGPFLLVGVAAFNTIPIAVGVAVTRYQLFNIDRIISRTASYAIVTGLLLATYALVAASISAVVGSGSTIAVAAATLAAAALARPVLRRVQDVVDHRFNRSRYDAVRTVETFGTRLRNQVDAHHVTDDLVSVVSTTLQPDHVAVWVREPR